jgi:two-component system CheB/CheR fusion protein
VPPTKTAKPDEGLEALLEYIKSGRGFDFTGYKRPSLSRRIDKRMDEVGCETYNEYLRLLEAEPQEFTTLFNTILINVTSFFRDPEAWEYMRAEVVPRVLETKKPDDPVRVWSTGCASGQETYTAAMVLAEALGGGYRDLVKIYGTDVDDDALATARHASYPVEQLEHVPEGLRETYFELVNGKANVRPDLRRTVIFGRHDLVQDPPISRIDLLIARNTLIYFSPKTQETILENFHFSLNPGGFLMLGRSEVVTSRSNLFEPVDLKRRVFSPVPKLGDFRSRLLHLVREDGGDDVAAPSHLFTERLRETAFELSPVAHLIVSGDGRLAFANNQARRLFGVSTEDLRRPLDDLELSRRPVELRALIDRAHAERKPMTINEAPFTAAGEDRHYDVQVFPMFGVEGAVGTSIVFTDVSRYKHYQQMSEEQQAQLAAAYEQAQSGAEELETTNEELQSTNEELETTNEELQSTNEELETMNEELQSTNEELETLNDELRRRSDEFVRTNDLIETILSQIRVAVILVDRALEVEAWSDRAEELWGLGAERVVGKNLLTLEIGFPLEELRDTIQACLAGDPAPEVVTTAVNRLGKEIRCRVTCAPVRDGGEPRGAILVMEEIDGG